VSRLPAILLVCLLAVAVANGCGEEGAAEGARVTVYLSASMTGPEAATGRRLCAEAREQAAQGRGDVELRLQVICLTASGPSGEWSLAQVGANARAATEDSTTVAYVGEPAAAARRQSGPILEAAEIAQLGGSGGHQAIARVQAALDEGDASDPRAAVFDAVE
jgi:hypothetical protein